VIRAHRKNRTLAFQLDHRIERAADTVRVMDDGNREIGAKLLSKNKHL